MGARLAFSLLATPPHPYPYFVCLCVRLCVWLIFLHVLSFQHTLWTIILNNAPKRSNMTIKCCAQKPVLAKCKSILVCVANEATDHWDFSCQLWNVHCFKVRKNALVHRFFVGENQCNSIVSIESKWWISHFDCNMQNNSVGASSMSIFGSSFCIFHNSHIFVILGQPQNTLLLHNLHINISIQLQSVCIAPDKRCWPRTNAAFYVKCDVPFTFYRCIVFDQFEPTQFSLFCIIQHICTHNTPESVRSLKFSPKWIHITSE